MALYEAFYSRQLFVLSKNIFCRGAAAAEGSSVSCCAQARFALCGHDSSAVGEGRCCGFNMQNCILVLFTCRRLPLPFTTLFFFSLFLGGPSNLKRNVSQYPVFFAVGTMFLQPSSIALQLVTSPALSAAFRRLLILALSRSTR